MPRTSGSPTDGGRGALAGGCGGERLPAAAWIVDPRPASGTLLRVSLEVQPGCRRLAIEIPAMVNAASQGLGPSARRHDWQLDLADLADAEARETALERIAAHAIDGLRWLSEDHQLPAVPLALSV